VPKLKVVKGFDGIAFLGVCIVIAGLAVAFSRQRPSSAIAQSSRQKPALVTEVYHYLEGDVKEIAARLRRQFQDNEQVRIVADPTTHRIIVRAPASIQQLIARQTPPPVADASVPGAAASAANPSPDGGSERAPETFAVQLRNITPSQLESEFRALLGSRLSPLPSSAAEVRGFRVGLSQGSAVELLLNRQTNIATLRGPGPAIQSALRLIHSLDAPRREEEPTTRAVSLRNASQASVRRAVEAIRTSGATPLRDTPVVAQVLQDPNQPPGRSAPRPAVGNGNTPNGNTPVEAMADAGGLIGPVQIELLEGLGVMVIKGHQRDVDRVVEIINRIDQLSAETEPDVRIHHLKHVECQALAELIGPLYEQVYEPRQSGVSITALTKPNALLLIGRPEAVQTVVGLIEQLDRPVAPGTQFRVFSLRHASATTAQYTIEQFFADREDEPRTALGTRVHVVADYRSNALIVQAGPRDMAEIAELIAKIDTETGEAVNDVRVFQLRNGLAEDLAEVLREAISMQQTGFGTSGFRPGQPGGSTAGRPTRGQMGATSQTGLEQKSAALRFITVDAQGKRLLRSGILTDVRISADVRANALVVSAPSNSMDLLAALIERLDELPATEAQVKVFTILNADAEGLLEMLETLFGTQAGADQPASMLAAAIESESSLVPLRFAVDVRTNSVIASGSIGDLSVVEAILLRLDDADVRARETHVFKLKNSPAADVANSINELLRSERALEQIAPGLVSPFEQIEREVVVVPEPVTNSLIVSATPRFYEEIEGIIKRLDEQPPMVVIQVLIAEVVLSDTEELGVEMGLQDMVLFDRSQLLTDTIGSLVNTPGFNFNNQPLGNAASDQSLAGKRTVGTQGLSHFGLGRTSAELGFGGFVFSAASGNVSVLLRALKQCGRLDVLARPQIMTLDNQSAQVQVGQSIARVTGTIVNSNQQSTQTVDVPTGLILLVTPRINEDGLVVMNISATNSELGSEAEGTPISISVTGEVLRSPPINIITAETTIAALDGQTVVLGGLITKDRDLVERKVPVLGDIPLLGWLARYEAEEIRRAELLIIMTPHVVRSREDADRIKQIEASRMHWCLGDVIKLTDDPQLMGGAEQFTCNETTVIYPDLDPTGEMLQMPEEIATPEAIPQRPAILPEMNAPQLRPPSSRPLELPIENVEPLGELAPPPEPRGSQMPEPRGSQLRFRTDDSAAYRRLPNPAPAHQVRAAVHRGPGVDPHARQPLPGGVVPSVYQPPAYQQPVEGHPGQTQAACYRWEQQIGRAPPSPRAEPYGRQPGGRVETQATPPEYRSPEYRPPEYRPSGVGTHWRNQPPRRSP